MNLIGRDKELRIVGEHLHAGCNLAVVGPAGVGKTALVTAATAGLPNVLYCADTSTLKTTCESLLQALGLSVAVADNIQRKRAILKAIAGQNVYFVFDHVQHVTPKLLSLLENIHESHRMMIVTRSLAWHDIGHLKMILWDFVTLPVANLPEPAARVLIRASLTGRGLEPAVWKLSKGNPRAIVELCALAATGRYCFAGYVATKLLAVDYHLREINRYNPAADSGGLTLPRTQR